MNNFHLLLSFFYLPNAPAFILVTFWQAELISYQPTIITFGSNKRLASALIPMIPYFSIYWVAAVLQDVPETCKWIILIYCLGPVQLMPIMSELADVSEKVVTELAREFRALYWVEIQHVHFFYMQGTGAQQKANTRSNSVRHKRVSFW